MNENAESLLKDPKCQKSKEHFMSALRVLELVQIAEIEMLLDTIIGVRRHKKWELNSKISPFQDLHGKEKELLLNESKEKIATRENALAKAKQIKAELNINWFNWFSCFYLFISIFNIWHLL